MLLGQGIGLGLSAVGGVVGGIQSARANRKADAMTAEQKAKNEAWYQRNYNTDYTQRADAQAILNQTREMAKQNRARTQAQGVVTGATDEAIAMQNEANNKMVSDTMAGLNVQAEAYKQGVENKFLNTDMMLSQQQIEDERKRAQQGAQAMSGAFSAASGIVGGIK